MIFTVFNWSQELEDSMSNHPLRPVTSVRKSLDGTRGIVTGAWAQCHPPEVQASELTQSEAIALMATPEWTAPEEV